MKRLRHFAYYEPATLEEAAATLAGQNGNAAVLAGGTDLVVDMKTERLRPAAVVNIKRVPGLEGIDPVPGGTRIGALTSVTAIERSPVVRERHPALAQAAGVLGSPPVRSLATIGGNVARASPASDLAPPLMVHRAIVTIAGVKGSRDEAIADLYLGPGVTTLSPGDVIKSVFVPYSPPRFGSSHLKIGTRGSGTDIAVVGVCAGVSLDGGGSIDAARIVLASVGPTPLPAYAAEHLLTGREPSERLLATAAETAAEECQPISDLRASASHRRALARVLTLRALRAACAAAEQEEAA